MKKSDNRKKKPATRNSAGTSVRKRMLRSFFLSAGIGALLILAASLALSLTPDPGVYIRPAALVCCGVTFLCAGLTAGKAIPETPVSAGAVNGLLLSALMLALSLLFRGYGSAYPAWVVVLLHTAAILLSLLGAMLSGRARKSQKPRRRRTASR